MNGYYGDDWTSFSRAALFFKVMRYRFFMSSFLSCTALLDGYFGVFTGEKSFQKYFFIGVLVSFPFPFLCLLF